MAVEPGLTNEIKNHDATSLHPIPISRFLEGSSQNDSERRLKERIEAINNKGERAVALVIKGGGVRFQNIMGCLSVLNMYGMIQNVDLAIGTSAGSIGLLLQLTCDLTNQAKNLQIADKTTDMAGLSAWLKLGNISKTGRSVLDLDFAKWMADIPLDQEKARENIEKTLTLITVHSKELAIKAQNQEAMHAVFASTDWTTTTHEEAIMKFIKASEASSGMPGFFTPTRDGANGKYQYYDGGVGAPDNFEVTFAEKLMPVGSTIIVIDTNPLKNKGIKPIMIDKSSGKVIITITPVEIDNWPDLVLRHAFTFSRDAFREGQIITAYAIAMVLNREKEYPLGSFPDSIKPGGQ